MLHTQGRRMTGQRVVILQIIQESNRHLDAEELYHLARKRNPRINLATVYRTLALLKESRLITPTYLSQDDRHGHFESRPEAEHYHFTCTRCGAVLEFESPLVAQLERQVERDLGVELMRITLCVEGYCGECKGGAR
ncbi:MAG: Fur family transcriptional regulator [Anaerolineae bacterium]